MFERVSIIMQYFFICRVGCFLYVYIMISPANEGNIVDK